MTGSSDIDGRTPPLVLGSVGWFSVGWELRATIPPTDPRRLPPVPEFRPFRGIRYRTDDLDAVTAPPYDVIDPPERDALAARSHHNSVRLILPGDGAAPDQDGYEQAADMLREWEADGVLERDDAPAFYSYRMTFTDDRGATRTSVGVLGGLVMPRASGEGDVLPHERTLPKAKSDRLALLRATRVNLDPIWGLTPVTGLAAIAARAIPLASTVDDDGVRHELGSITDPEEISLVRAIVADEPIVLADGHHRFETAIAYRDERRAAGITEAGDDAVMCLVVELAEEHLWVQPIHRVLRNVASSTGLRLALAKKFRIVDAAPNTPAALAALTTTIRDQGGVGLVDSEGLARLVADADDLARVPRRSRTGARGGAVGVVRSQSPRTPWATPRSPTATTPRPSPRWWRPARPMLRSSLLRSRWTRSAPRPKLGCGCRRRPRSSPRSPAPASSSAASTNRRPPQAGWRCVAHSRRADAADAEESFGCAREHAPANPEHLATNAAGTSRSPATGTGATGSGDVAGNPASKRSSSSTSNAQPERNGSLTAAASAGPRRNTLAPHCVSYTAMPSAIEAADANTRPT